MKCPFKLPVEKDFLCEDDGVKLFSLTNAKGSAEFPYTENEADYIVQAINSHEKLVKALKENYEYTKYAGANKRINTKEYMEEFFNRGLSAQQIAEQALKEAEKQ